jgi:hypothetical protein
VYVPPTPCVRSAFAVDIDNDGMLDVVTNVKDTSTGQVVWYRNMGGSPPAWTRYNISRLDGGAFVVAVDIDKDGLVDVVSSSPTVNQIAWFKNSGGLPPVWTANTIANASAVQALSAVDIDGDGRVDILSAASTTNTLAWYRNNEGSPPTWTASTVSTAVSSPRWVVAADVDSDGRPDVLSASYFDNKVAWFRNGGGSAPLWTAFTISTAASGAQAVFAADVNGDGRVDALSASVLDNKIAWCVCGFL